ncbi:FADR157Wp [Eremothecium gossypii FDAG1]|nr:FADR157Wp [Eremothecium gossypii FDAG1]
MVLWAAPESKVAAMLSSSEAAVSASFQLATHGGDSEGWGSASSTDKYKSSTGICLVGWCFVSTVTLALGWSAKTGATSVRVRRGKLRAWQQQRMGAGVLERCWERADARTLRAAALMLGAAYGSKKADARAQLAMQVARLRRLRDVRLRRGRVALLAVDPGLVNFAYAQLYVGTGAPVVVAWDKLDLRISAASAAEAPEAMGEMVRGVVGRLLAHEPDFVAIERQRARNPGSSAVAGAVLRTNLLEHGLHAVLPPLAALRGMPEPLVAASLPRRMADFWCGPGAERAADSKRLRILLARALLREAAVAASPGMLALGPALAAARDADVGSSRAFSIHRALGLPAAPVRDLPVAPAKDDDLADALLHALAWATWLEVYEQLEAFAAARGSASGDALVGYLHELVAGHYARTASLLRGSPQPATAA